MAWFAGSVKLDWTPDPVQFVESANQIGEATQSILNQDIEKLLTLPDESQKIILTNLELDAYVARVGTVHSHVSKSFL